MPRDDEDDRPRRRRTTSPGVLLILILALGLFALGCCGAASFLIICLSFAAKESPDGVKKVRAVERQRIDDDRRARDTFNR